MKDDAKDEGCGCPVEAAMTRGGFLAWATAGLGAAAAAVLGGAGGAYFLSPAFDKDKENWVDVGPAKSIKAGTPTKVEFVQRRRDAWVTTERRSSAWVLTSDHRDFIVYNPRCTHLGCPFRWSDDKKQFLCPCHSGVFSIDGRVIAGPPPRPLDRYPAKVVGGRLMILPSSEVKKA
ncbi:MAG: ubiquinol-cytochrome c reductase iron-sulfur subunit [Elusimicrobia bacterium]|nr:ubiquinol-cytochrome c reductase iron-sulfur subunit [Elusimicrobiota bacterium]